MSTASSFKPTLKSQICNNACQHLGHSLSPACHVHRSVSCSCTVLPFGHLLSLTLDDLCVNAAILLCSLAQETAVIQMLTVIWGIRCHICLVHWPCPLGTYQVSTVTCLNKGFQSQACILGHFSVFRGGLSWNNPCKLTSSTVTN